MMNVSLKTNPTTESTNVTVIAIATVSDVRNSGDPETVRDTETYLRAFTLTFQEIFLSVRTHIGFFRIK